MSSAATWREPYFSDADGREWRVYDCAWDRNGRLRDVWLGNVGAEVRVFVPREGTRLVYRFGPADSARADRRPAQAPSQVRADAEGVGGDVPADAEE